jgi:hypothetical protein
MAVVMASTTRCVGSVAAAGRGAARLRMTFR